MKIDIYTHIVPQKYKSALGRISTSIENHLSRIPALYNLDERFKIMDNFPEVKQVLTLAMTAGLMLEDPKMGKDLAKQANDEMAEIVFKYPNRFVAGVASISLSSIEEALNEIERGVNELKLKGIQLFFPFKDGSWNLKNLLPIFKKISEVDLPIWIHPFRPINREDYERYFIDHVFGWPYESTVAMAHLVFQGVMENIPNLKIIIHHCGAMVPFFGERIREAYNASKIIHAMDFEGKLKKHPLEYFKMFYTDTAIGGSTTGLLCGYSFFGPDHLLFGTDTPYDSEYGGRTIKLTIESIKRMPIPDDDKRKIFEKNAKKLLRI